MKLARCFVSEMSGGPDVPAPYQSQAEESKLAAADSKFSP